MRRRFAIHDTQLAVGFAALAVAAIIASIFKAPEAVRAPIVVLSILLGPAVLLWRLLTPRPWFECVLVGAALDVAMVMVGSLILVWTGRWHPLRVELAIPALSIVGAVYLYRTAARHRDAGAAT
jgi:hypothetical protein